MSAEAARSASSCTLAKHSREPPARFARCLCGESEIRTHDTR